MRCIQKDESLRQAILVVEESINAIHAAQGTEPPDLPLQHVFAPGVYGRQIFIPAGTLVVGKIHRHAHLNFLIQGTVSVATEEGPVQYHAPLMMVSKAGTKRVVYTHEDTIWATVHLTEQTDLEKIEEEIIVPSYAAFDLLQDEAIRQLAPLLELEAL